MSIRCVEAESYLLAVILLSEKSKELKSDDEMFRAITKTSPDIILVFDQSSKCLYSNENIRLLIEVDAEDVIGKNIEDIILPENIKSELAFELRKVIKKKQSKTKLIFQPISGKTYEFRLVPEHNVTKNGSTILVIGRDITEKYKIEKEMIRAKQKAEESERLKMAFLANISHEIRTPLNGIIGFARLLNKKGISEEKKSSFLSIIESSTDTLLRTISNILEISKLETGEFTVIKDNINLENFFQRIYSDYKIYIEKKNKSSIKFFLEIPLKQKKIILYIDEYRLREVLHNLLDNAFKFTRKGFVKIGYLTKKDQVIMYVKDSGKGIAKKNIIRIFNRFYQEDLTERKEFEGLGLGLTISKAIIEKMGGKIRIESNINKGTTFFIILPLKDNIRTQQKTVKLHKDGIVKIK